MAVDRPERRVVMGPAAPDCGSLAAMVRASVTRRDAGREGGHVQAHLGGETTKVLTTRIPVLVCR
jgi:hypothetical protein